MKRRASDASRGDICGTPESSSGVELGRELEVVVLRARPAAELPEVEPDDAAGAAPRADLAMLDLQQRAFVLGLGEALEGVAHRRVGIGPERRVIELDLEQRRLAVVDRAVDVDDLELVLQQLDRRQDPLAVQAVRIERRRAGSWTS